MRKMQRKVAEFGKCLASEHRLFSSASMLVTSQYNLFICINLCILLIRTSTDQYLHILPPAACTTTRTPYMYQAFYNSLIEFQH